MNGHCYFLIQGNAASWAAMRDACIALGAHLVTITDGAEEAFVEPLVGQTDRWIGASRQQTNPWTWVTGEAWGYTHWGNNEPNETSTACVRLRVALTWGDQGCTQTYGAICERE